MSHINLLYSKLKLYISTCHLGQKCKHFIREIIIGLIVSSDILSFIIYFLDPTLWDLLCEHFKQHPEIKMLSSTTSDVVEPTIQNPGLPKTTKIILVGVGVLIMAGFLIYIFNDGVQNVPVPDISSSAVVPITQATNIVPVPPSAQYWIANGDGK